MEFPTGLCFLPEAACQPQEWAPSDCRPCSGSPFRFRRDYASREPDHREIPAQSRAPSQAAQVQVPPPDNLAALANLACHLGRFIALVDRMLWATQAQLSCSRQHRLRRRHAEQEGFLDLQVTETKLVHNLRQWPLILLQLRINHFSRHLRLEHLPIVPARRAPAARTLPAPVCAGTPGRSFRPSPILARFQFPKGNGSTSSTTSLSTIRNWTRQSRPPWPIL